MRRSRTGLVLGYHGCDHDIAEKLLKGKPFALSKNDYDWLGAGAYFWENDPVRAYHWSVDAIVRREKDAKGRRKPKPGVVGAVIDLGLCLDLTTQASLDVIRTAHDELMKVYAATGETAPENKGQLLRGLDCAVLNFLYQSMPEPQFQTARGMFLEGKPLYPGALIQSKTHVQLAVRDLACIRGVFRVPAAELPDEASR